MLENLPAKRVCRQIFPNLQAKKRVRKFMPVNTLTRSRQQMHLKPTATKANRNFKFISTTQTTVNAIRKNISRRLRFFATNSNEMVRRSARSATIKQQNTEETPDVSAKSHGVVKNITRRTQRLFPKLTNSFRRPLQKRNLRNAASPKSVEADSSSIINRMKNSRRVQVTLKKLDDNIVDLVKLEEVQPDGESTDVKAPVKKQTIKRLIKSIRGKRAGSKKTSEQNEEEILSETPSLDLKVDEDEVKNIDELQETPIQIDETSQSSNRSGSNRKSKRNSNKKQKSIEVIDAEVSIQIENDVETKPHFVEETKTDHEAIATESPCEEPMDLSQSKARLSVPVVQDPIKTPPMKRRTRKLNDCIAMLTGKLQEKLGVPFLNSETNILLSPTKSEIAESSEIVDKDERQKEEDQATNMQTPTKEPTSSHSTPTKRASRKDRAINLDSNESTKTNVIPMKTMTDIVTEVQTSNQNDVASDDLSQIGVPSAAEVTHTIQEDTVVIVSQKKTVVDNPPALSCNLMPNSEDVQPKRGALKLENLNADKQHSVNKKPVKGKKIKPIEKLSDKNKVKFCPLHDVATSEKSTTDTDNTKLKAAKRREAKKKILQDATITVDIVEPSVMENSSVDLIGKKRETENSSLTPIEDKSPEIDTVDETKIVSEELTNVMSKQKSTKGNDTKNAENATEKRTTRRINTKIECSPPAVGSFKNSVAGETIKPIDDGEKDVTKGRKPKKKSVVTETKVSKVVTTYPHSEEEEMHPWDPEIGFISANIPETASTPAIDSTPDSEPIIEIQDPSSSCSEIKETTKVADEKLATKKKRRKNELAKIIADQLLESFKEVDKSRIEELKLLHDLSIESNDDLLLSTTMSRTPPPKRRTASNIRNESAVDVNTNHVEVSASENVEKNTSKRKKAIESKKSTQNTKIGKNKKNVSQKSNKKDNKKKTADIASSGYLSDTEVQSQPKVPVTLRRRLTICDESPKRMSRNSKETEVSVSLFNSFKKRKNINEISTKQKPKDTNLRPQLKVPKRKNKRNLLQQLSKDLATNDTNQMTSENVPLKSSSDKCEDSGKSKSNVNDLVTQIINDFTTSTLNSPTTSPILFGDVSKPHHNNTATKLSSVLSNKKNILNGDTLTNGFKSDVSKEITFATLSQPLKDKAVEQIRTTDSSSIDAKQPLRAPFMSPRWDPSDEWSGTSKPIKDSALHKLWTLNNKDEQLSSEKSLYQCVKEKTKKLLGKISKKKTRKHDVTMNNKKLTATAAGMKRPLLRPSILSVSNHTSKLDIVDSENCLKKLESSSLFLGKVCNFENDSMAKIFRNDKLTTTTTGDDCTEKTDENELFNRKTDIDTTVLSNLKSNFEKEDASKWKMEKKFGEKVSKCRDPKNDSKLTVEKTNKRHSSKRNIRRKQKTVYATEKNEAKTVLPVIDDPKKDNVEKATVGSTIKRRKMGSTKRKTDNAVSVTNAPNDLNKAFCSKEDSTIKQTSTDTKPVTKASTTKPFDESSQDTIISEIVNKIRDSNNDQATESDEDLSLAEIAKNMNSKITNCDEFSNGGVAAPVELSESFVSKSDFSSLVAVLNLELDSKNDEKTEETTNFDDDVEDGEFMNDTNTDLIDMDLEDTASVYTSSMETTVTTSGGSQKGRKRRHRRSILMKPSRKSKRSDGSFLTPGESFFCDLCSKTFRTQGGLGTHRTTLTHISKLSEHEFKLKMETPKDYIPESKLVTEEDVTTKPDVTKSPIIESSSQPHVPLTQSPSSAQRHLPITSPIRNQSMTYLNNIEPISSPEQHDLHYDRYSATSRSRNNLPIHENSRIALSQEQRFFYECCSMLKGSDRSNVNPSDSPNKYYTLPERSEIITKPVTPRSNEQYSYVVPEGSKHSKGIPKIDLNQFSDISSDSNPAYSCPQNPSSSETQNIFPVESKRITEKRDYHSSERNFDSIKKDGRTFNERTTIVESEYLETYSDMGDSFPSSQDVSESEQYSQTILERSSNSVGLIRGGYQDSSSAMYGKNCDSNKKRRNVFTIAMESNEAKGFSNR